MNLIWLNGCSILNLAYIIFFCNCLAYLKDSKWFLFLTNKKKSITYFKQKRFMIWGGGGRQTRWKGARYSAQERWQTAKKFQWLVSWRNPCEKQSCIAGLYGKKRKEKNPIKFYLAYIKFLFILHKILFSLQQKFLLKKKMIAKQIGEKYIKG